MLWKSKDGLPLHAYFYPFYLTAGWNIRDPNFLKASSRGKIQGVSKRDFSMKCEHVLLPTTPNPAFMVKESLRAERETWKQVEDFFGMVVCSTQMCLYLEKSGAHKYLLGG